jgi:hypothetical protein
MDIKELNDFQFQVRSAQKEILDFENLPDNIVMAFSENEIEDARRQANNVLENTIVKKRVCGALKSVSKDINIITEKATESLVGMVAVGTIVITQNPLIYAWIGVIIFNASVEFFCVEFNKKTSE